MSWVRTERGYFNLDKFVRVFDEEIYSSGGVESIKLWGITQVYDHSEEEGCFMDVLITEDGECIEDIVKILEGKDHE